MKVDALRTRRTDDKSLKLKRVRNTGWGVKVPVSGNIILKTT